jgi:cell division protein FtsB
MGIKENTEILSNPLKMQQMKLQMLQIKEQKNKWIYIFVAFILGFLSSIGSNLILGYLDNDKQQNNSKQFLETINNQSESIKRLINENEVLKQSIENNSIKLTKENSEK